jgi:hypothetical protein
MAAPGNRAVREVRDAEVRFWEQQGYRLVPEPAKPDKKPAAKKSTKKK